jgi:hypothetical protein
MDSAKIKQFLVVLVIVFVSAAGVAFLANVTNVFETDLSTWQIIINAGVVAVVTYVVAYLVPFNKAFGIGSK